MKSLDSALLKKFLKKAGDSLKGDWLLVGGTLLPAVGINIRSTVDIDLIGLGDREAGQNLELMSLAEGLGLGVEVINQAAAFFLRKVGYKKSDLIPFHKGTSAVIHRPSAELYWKLKTARLTETDAQDCEHYLRYCLARKDTVDLNALKNLIQDALRAENLSVEKLKRLRYLQEII